MSTLEKIKAIRAACIEANPKRQWKEYVPHDNRADEYRNLDCRLADVLFSLPHLWVYAAKKVQDFRCLGYGLSNPWVKWNLREDSIVDQDESTIDFIYSVLKK